MFRQIVIDSFRVNKIQERLRALKQVIYFKVFVYKKFNGLIIRQKGALLSSGFCGFNGRDRIFEINFAEKLGS